MEAVQKMVVLESTPDLEKFVEDATWKDVLIQLVNKNELDPWNIDISRLVEEYLSTIRKVQLLDLKVPANIMLAAAILVRLKSDLLNFDEAQQEESVESEAPMLYADTLFPKGRLPPKRKITLKELIDALEEAIKIKESREERLAKSHEYIPFVVSTIDVEQEANEIFEILKKNADKMNMLTFSTLIKVAEGKDPLLEVFIPLLFLAQQQKIVIMQEEFFGEILIKLA